MMFVRVNPAMRGDHPTRAEKDAVSNQHSGPLHNEADGVAPKAHAIDHDVFKARRA